MSFKSNYSFLSRICWAAILWAALLCSNVFNERANAQSYTYDPPACGAVYRDEPAKPRTLRVTWEIGAGNLCTHQSRFPDACRHFENALEAADRMEPEAGNPEDIKSFIRTMLKTNGCHKRAKGYSHEKKRYCNLRNHCSYFGEYASLWG